MLSLGGCAVGYYWQAAQGQWQVLTHREPIPRLLDDPRVDPALKARLRRALMIRDYAARRLALPDNGAYRSYADLGRPYAVWNVFAAPEFSLEPHRWCYPLIGCASYRGYFHRRGAETEAKRLQQAGYDTFIAGIPAYSTLGWFDDPLLNTVIHWREPQLAGLIFHELAHQVVYVRGDTTFNESFASAVERLGVMQWLNERGTPEQRQDYDRYLRHRDQFDALLRRYRDELARRYAQGGDPTRLRQTKQALFAALRTDYQALKHRWRQGPYFDRWFQAPVNNARFVPLHDYTRLRAAFVCLRQAARDWPDFYATIRRLARLPPRERTRRLESTCDRGGSWQTVGSKNDGASPRPPPHETGSGAG